MHKTRRGIHEHRRLPRSFTLPPLRSADRQEGDLEAEPQAHLEVEEVVTPIDKEDLKSAPPQQVPAWQHISNVKVARVTYSRPPT